MLRSDMRVEKMQNSSETGNPCAFLPDAYVLRLHDVMLISVMASACARITSDVN